MWYNQLHYGENPHARYIKPGSHGIPGRYWAVYVSSKETCLYNSIEPSVGTSTDGSTGSFPTFIGRPTEIETRWLHSYD